LKRKSNYHDDGGDDDDDDDDDNNNNNLYTSPSVITMIKSKTIRWVGYVAGMGRRRMHIGYWWESQNSEEKDVGGWIILKWILER
jgi:hypothetical protein